MAKPIETLDGSDATAFRAALSPHIDAVLDSKGYSPVAEAVAEAGASREIAVAKAADAAYWAGQAATLPSMIRPVGEENGGALGWRWRVGNRLYASFDAGIGHYFRKARLGANVTVDDNTALPLSSRLLSSPVGSFFQRFGDGLGESTMRFRIGNRLYATLDTVSGWYPRKATLPASTVIDDSPTATLLSRLVSAGIGLMLRQLPVEAGGIMRFRLGNRLLGQWTSSGGFQWSRQTLPADCKIADQPSVNLVDRLGGSFAGMGASTSYLAVAGPDTLGRQQVSVRRKSDGKRIQITAGAASCRSPIISGDSAVLFYSDADQRAMWAPVEGGAIWPVDPYDVIDCWGDSLTAGAGSTGGQSYPAQLAAQLGGVVSAVNNNGIGGQISADIAARQGGSPALITVTGNQIPASGPVTVTAYSQDLLYNSGTSGSATLAGTLAGVPGTLSGNAVTGRNNATYTFTRTAAGVATACPAATPFIPDKGVATQARVQLFTYGRNDGTSGTATIIAKLQASIGYLKAYVPRYLVGGTLAAPGDSLAAFNTQNAALLAQFGTHFVDLNAVPTIEEMTRIGFVPDSYGTYSNGRTDAGDLAAGYIPSGMRSGATTGNGDFLHMNNFGYALWALRYRRALYAMGWFPALTFI